MPFPLPLLILALPLAELAGLIVVGGRVGAFPVIAWVVLSAVIGGNILRIAGWETARKVQAAMTRGEMPLSEMLSGAALSIAALLLILPGFLTDALGLLLLIGPLRRAIGALIAGRAAHAAKHGDATVIEGEFTVVDEPDSSPAAPPRGLPRNDAPDDTPR